MKYILSLGSNLGDRKDFVFTGFLFLSGQGKIIGKSSLYETTPVEMSSGTRNFYNAIAIIEADISPSEFLERIKQFEQTMGRDIINSHMKSRKIDIDIIFAGNEIIKTEALEIPHPEMLNRKFVLLPLSEIAPDMIHPGNGKSISEILKNLESDEKVNRLKNN